MMDRTQLRHSMEGFPMSRKIKRAAAIGAVLALAAAPAALAAKPADPGSQGQGHGNGHAKNGGKGTVMYVFKGAYQLDGNVAVDRGNAHARKAGLVDSVVAFDLSQAKVVVGDVNGDGSAD